MSFVLIRESRGLMRKIPSIYSPGRLLALMFCSAQILSGGAWAKGENGACDEYVKFLSGNGGYIEKEATEYEGCSEYEAMVLQGMPWGKFIISFKAKVSQSAYPVQVFLALDDWKILRGGTAVLRLDAAFSSAHRAFPGQDSEERLRVYSYLILSVRNLILEYYVSDSAFLKQIKKFNPPDPLKEVVAQKIDAVTALQCLILIDALTANVSDVLASQAYSRCVSKR